MTRYLDYKHKVNNFNDIAVTIKTIEQVAASHMQVFKHLSEQLKHYTQSTTDILARLEMYYHQFQHPLLQKRTTGKNILFLITSDKGLVGGLYHDLISMVLQKHADYQALFVVGNKGKQYLEEEQIPVTAPFFLLSEVPQTEEITTIANYFFTLYTQEPIKQVDIVFPQFTSLAKQNPALLTFLPFDFRETIQTQSGIQEPLGFPLFDASKSEIFFRLLEKYIHSALYKIIIESKLSELAARTISMEHSSVKIRQFEQRLSLQYFKERRSSVTQKQLESFTAHTMT